MSPDPRSEELSALLDGELGSDREAELRAWLSRVPEAQAELDELAAVRSMVRELPIVDPPFGFYERMLREPGRRRWRPGVALGAVAAMVASFVLLAGLTPAGDRFVPPVEAFASRHESMSAGRTPDVSTVAAFRTLDASDPAEMERSALPGELAHMPQAGAYTSDGVVHVMYGDAASQVSVYEQRGGVDWASMPTYGEEMTIDGSSAWMMQEAGIEVVVLERTFAVYTIVFEGDHDEMMEVVEEIPEGSEPSLAQRCASTLEQLARGFGLEG